METHGSLTDQRVSAATNRAQIGNYCNANPGQGVLSSFTQPFGSMYCSLDANKLPCAQMHTHRRPDHRHLHLQLSPTKCSQHRTTRSTVLLTTCNSTDDKQRDLVFARGASQGTGHIHHHYTSPPMQVDAHSEH